MCTTSRESYPLCASSTSLGLPWSRCSRPSTDHLTLNVQNVLLDPRCGQLIKRDFFCLLQVRVVGINHRPTPRRRGVFREPWGVAADASQADPGN